MFVADDPGKLTEEEWDQRLTQEQVDALPSGTRIWFRNKQHLLIPEVVQTAKGQVSKKWPKRGPAVCPCLSDFFETWLYNVGTGETSQQVWLRETTGKP